MSDLQSDPETIRNAMGWAKFPDYWDAPDPTAPTPAVDHLAKAVEFAAKAEEYNLGTLDQYRRDQAQTYYAASQAHALIALAQGGR